MNVYNRLDEGSIDAPTLAGRLVQMAILLVKEIAVEWNKLSPYDKRVVRGGFPEYVYAQVIQQARGTLWETKLTELQAVARAARSIALKHGPEV